jgi:RNA polymerase sigma-70 factor (ECF subfamily)
VFYRIKDTDSMDRTDDRQLIRRLQVGDEEAVRELAERYSHRIFQMALRHMKNREDAEEVTQDVLMKVCRKIDKFRGDAALSSWIYRITFNTAMSRLRTRRAERAADAEGERVRAHGQAAAESPSPRQPADWSHMPDEELLRGQLREAVADALPRLPEIYRVPVVLRDIEGLTTEEASTRLRVKDQTLKSRLHRGRVMLRQQLSAFTSGLEIHRQAA